MYQCLPCFAHLIRTVAPLCRIVLSLLSQQIRVSLLQFLICDLFLCFETAHIVFVGFWMGDQCGQLVLLGEIATEDP
ncbi:hypothetical protein FGO68_gene3443 [Halteria grandinella]|uniref:Uncharacterized protein n=1 Tax=Halteria grandinella TaxID=5974 RepID=A0A8J8P3E5_HALGN|nr:hypothetical protein FGO68_gene3443 [Halteria grandinella]